MTDDTRIPDMAHTHIPDAFQGRGREIVHFSAAVLFKRTILLAGGILVPIKSGKDLVKNNFLFHQVSIGFYQELEN